VKARTQHTKAKVKVDFFKLHTLAFES